MNIVHSFVVVVAPGPQSPAPGTGPAGPPWGDQPPGAGPGHAEAHGEGAECEAPEHTHLHARTHVHSYAHTHIHTLTHTHSHILSHSNTYNYILSHSHIHTYTHTRARTIIHPSIHPSITHTHSSSDCRLMSSQLSDVVIYVLFLISRLLLLFYFLLTSGVLEKTIHIIPLVSGEGD